MAHCEAMADLKAALAKHDNLHPVVFIALAAQLIGNLIALQDQTKFTPEMLMDVVARNIEIGNATAISNMLGSPKGSA